MTQQKAESGPPPAVPEPVDMVDGIPDRSANRGLWKYALIGLIFLAWLVFLLYCGFAGGVEN